jgi:hypothetical protein
MIAASVPVLTSTARSAGRRGLGAVADKGRPPGLPEIEQTHHLRGAHLGDPAAIGVLAQRLARHVRRQPTGGERRGRLAVDDERVLAPLRLRRDEGDRVVGPGPGNSILVLVGRCRCRCGRGMRRPRSRGSRPPRSSDWSRRPSRAWSGSFASGCRDGRRSLGVRRDRCRCPRRERHRSPAWGRR